MSELYGLRNGPLYQEITHDGGNIQIEEIVGILNGNVNSAERKLKKIKQLEQENAELRVALGIITVMTDETETSLAIRAYIEEALRG